MPRFAVISVILIVAPLTGAADWPTYMRDNRRSGATPDELAFPLQPRWVYQARHAPSPAWPPEAKADYYHNKYDLPERVTFDHAFHVVGAGGRVYFGSSADDAVYCLDANTGAEIWSFVTEGPVRLAPTVAGELVLFGSDDGFVYAVKAKDGALAWKRRIGPGPRRIPGNERVISVWPVRTDVFVEDGKAYVCAGLFPSQGVYQAVLDLRDGAVLSNKTLTVTAQGYQEKVFGKLMIGTGRNPAGKAVADLPAEQPPGKEAKSPLKDYPFALIKAGKTRIAGGGGKVAAFGPDDKVIWEAKVEGKAYSLAVADGRLLVSTDRGVVYSFVPGNPGDAVEEHHIPRPATGLSNLTPGYTRLVERLVKDATGELGYGLVLGANEQLVFDLAHRTKWRIVVREPDEAKAATLRRAAAKAGLGHRVSAHHGPLDALPYTDYLFNVVIAMKAETPREEVLRVTRPHGGLAVFDFDAKSTVRRGPLEGAGEWSHMYADPSNTSCSNDALTAGELQLQWFGRPGPRGLIDRHHRTVAPLTKAGRLIVPGEDRVTAVDAYNGTILWERDIPNSRRVIAFRDSSYLALSDSALYVAAADKCVALNPQTGVTERTLALPGRPGKYEWGYVAAAENLLIGSAVKAGSIRREQSHKNTVTETHWDFVPAVGSDCLFAYAAAGDKRAWEYRPKVGLIVNPTLAIGNGRIYFIESINPATLKAPSARAKLADLLGQGSAMVALDLYTGKELWRKPGEPFAALQHIVYGSYAKEKFVVVGSRNVGTGKAGRLWFDVHVFDARTGEKAWSTSQDQHFGVNGEHGEQDRHPAIVGDKLFCEPYSYDLHTGAPLDWKWPWVNSQRRGCGTLSASAAGLFFRGDTAKSFDLTEGKANPITTETRPGCWINLLPAGGLILAPEASSGCTCNYSVQTSLALIPVRK
jgi:outer membrane protein assembly factor BamB